MRWDTAARPSPRLSIPAFALAPAPPPSSPPPCTPSPPWSPPPASVGRATAPTKRQDALGPARAALPAPEVTDAALPPVGTADDTSTYVARLRTLVSSLGVEDAVDIVAERVTDSQVAARYANAAVFATASEHEGFCVPLVEAMAFDLPVVAYAAAAVPETAGGAALLLDDRDPLLWAAA